MNEPDPVLSLNLGCNVFEPGLPTSTLGLYDRNPSVQRVGIQIAKNDNPPGQICRLGFVSPASPQLDFSSSANIFPLADESVGVPKDRSRLTPACSTIAITDVEDLCNSWTSPSNWVSIRNTSSQTVRYFSYRNEFLGLKNGVITPVRIISLPSADNSLAASSNFPPLGGFTNQTIYEERCGMAIDFQVFPIVTSVHGSTNPVARIAFEVIERNSFILAPNPASNFIRSRQVASAKFRSLKLVYLGLVWVL